MQRKTILIAIAAAVLATGGAAAARYSALKSWGLQCLEPNGSTEYMRSLFIKEKFFGGLTASFRIRRSIDVDDYYENFLFWKDYSDSEMSIKRFPHGKHNGLYVYQLKNYQKKSPAIIYECVSVSPSLR